jgi:hypothetical protein
VPGNATDVYLRRRVYEAFNARDVDALLALCDPSVVVESVFGVVGSAASCGVEQLGCEHGTSSRDITAAGLPAGGIPLKRKAMRAAASPSGRASRPSCVADRVHQLLATDVALDKLGARQIGAVDAEGMLAIRM